MLVQNCQQLSSCFAMHVQACLMLSSVVTDGLDDLLVQYFKLRFNISVDDIERFVSSSMLPLHIVSGAVLLTCGIDKLARVPTSVTSKGIENGANPCFGHACRRRCTWCMAFVKSWCRQSCCAIFSRCVRVCQMRMTLLSPACWLCMWDATAVHACHCSGGRD